MFCTKCDSKSDLSDDADDDSAKCKKLREDIKNLSDELRRSFSEPDLTVEDDNRVCNTKYLTSTPACLPTHTCPDVIFTPNKDRESMSPITRSAQKMCRAMQVHLKHLNF